MESATMLIALVFQMYGAPGPTIGTMKISWLGWLAPLPETHVVTPSTSEQALPVTRNPFRPSHGLSYQANAWAGPLVKASIEPAVMRGDKKLAHFAKLPLIRAIKWTFQLLPPADAAGIP
jgi:hypothetical protein